MLLLIHLIFVFLNNNDPETVIKKSKINYIVRDVSQV